MATRKARAREIGALAGDVARSVMAQVSPVYMAGDDHAIRDAVEEVLKRRIPEPGLHEELVGELEHGEKTAAQLAAVLGEDIGAVVDALVMLLSEGVVEAESGPVIYRVKGGAR